MCSKPAVERGEAGSTIRVWKHTRTALFDKLNGRSAGANPSARDPSLYADERGTLASSIWAAHPASDRRHVGRLRLRSGHHSDGSRQLTNESTKYVPFCSAPPLLSVVGCLPRSPVESHLDRQVKSWQRRLEMDDWRLTIRLVRQNDLDKTPGATPSGIRTA